MHDFLFFGAAGNLEFAIYALIIGLLIGSFLNVVIHRIPKMMQREWENAIAEEQDQAQPHTDQYNLMLPRSACPHCGHAITAMENIPVLSFLFIKGKCTGCKAPISKRYPIIELITGLVTGYLVWHFGANVKGFAAVVFFWVLLCLTMIDYDTQLLPDDLTLGLLWLGVLLNLDNTFTSLSSSVIGAVCGYIALWAVYWLFKLITGKEGMGYGDFKLLAALGAWLGWTYLPLIIILSSFVGAVIGVALILFKGMKMSKPIPFGPYLAGAGMIALLWGDVIINEYLNFLL
jgi:leader peptidase (prepilin peptidase)/N-methyltransferase